MICFTSLHPVACGEPVTRQDVWNCTLRTLWKAVTTPMAAIMPGSTTARTRG
jgi:hypothetical protein